MIDHERGAATWLARLPGFTEERQAKLELLVARLREENKGQNLVAEASLDHVWQRHIADSAQLVECVPRETTPWLDLGTGAGFPGIVVAICCPAREIVMVESRKRRVEWLEAIRLELGLANARVIGMRIEQVERFDAGVISARAFAPLDRLLALAARFSTSGTRWVLPKGGSATQELESLRGWKHMFHVEQSLTNPQAGIIVGRLLGRKGKTS